MISPISLLMLRYTQDLNKHASSIICELFLGAIVFYISVFELKKNVKFAKYNGVQKVTCNNHMHLIEERYIINTRHTLVIFKHISFL